MRVTSTVPGYVALADIPPDRRESAWTDVYEAAYPEIFATYHSGWGKHERCLAAAVDVPSEAPRILAVEARARALLEETERSFRADGLLSDDLDVVLLVGGHTSNGWITELDETVTLFLALEFLGDPPYDGVLASHEAFHVAHSRHGADGWPEDGAASLFQEGIATAISRQLHPGLDDSAYLWFDDRHDDWVRECAASERAIVRRALDHLGTSYDEKVCRALFTTQDDEHELPPRAGYWLGDLLVRRLLAEHPSSELLTWDHATVTAALRDHLSAGSA
ncbi:MAG: hypothetical protein QM747_08260 [Nocardioides sp.]